MFARTLCSALKRMLPAGVAMAGVFAGSVNAADTYPSRPITLTVPYGAGGSTDSLARSFAERLGSKLGVSVIVDYKAGAGGTLGAAHVKNQAPDGYSLTLLPLSVLRQPYLVKVNYEPLKDLTWISAVANYSYVVAVPESSTWQTINELVDDVKANPGKFNYAASAQYSSNHLAMAELGRVADLDWTFIPYKGDAEAITSLLGSNVDIISATSTILPFVKDKKVRPLAVAGSQRSPDFEGVPTLKESGYDVEMASPLGVGGPANMPVEVVNKLESAIAAVMADPVFLEKARFLGFELAHKNHKDYTAWAEQTYANEKTIIGRLAGE